MIALPRSLAAWSGPDFKATLQVELEEVGASRLPLQQGLSRSSHALEPFKAMLIGARDDAECIHARVGIFYFGIIAGCSCADDPTPVEPQSEYCEVLVSIDRATAEASVRLATEE